MTQPARGRRGRPALPPAQQRQRLLDASLRVIQRGDEEVGVKEIVREAGMSSRAFYELFPSKEELVLELVKEASRDFVGRIDAAFAPGLTVLEIADRLLAAYFEELAPVVVIDRRLLGRGVGQRVEAVHDHFFARITDVVLAQIQGALEAGIVARVPDRVMLEVVLTGIEGLTRRYHREGRMQDLAKMRPELARALLDLVR